MTKQTKLVKSMIFVLMLIPVALFFVGVVQTFVLKDAQSKLLAANQNLSQAELELEKYKEQHSYMFNADGSVKEEYLEEFYKHNPNGSIYYGKDGDVVIILK